MPTRLNNKMKYNINIKIKDNDTKYIQRSSCGPDRRSGDSATTGSNVYIYIYILNKVYTHAISPRHDRRCVHIDISYTITKARAELFGVNLHGEMLDTQES